jgi:hypothetical protein
MMQQISDSEDEGVSCRDGAADPSGRTLKTLINVFEYLIDGKK